MHRKQAIITITPRPPYDFELTAAYATYFRGRYGADTFENGVLRHPMALNSGPCLASVCSSGSVDSPRLEVVLRGPQLEGPAIQEAREQITRLVGADQDIAGFYSLAETDPHLAPVVSALRGLHVPQTATVFEGLVLAILGQQISSHVARMLRTLLIETYGPSWEEDGVTYHAFPDPEAIAAAGVEGLRSIKMSARKAEYIVEIAKRVASGELDLEGLREQPDEEIARILTGIRGVGLWTVQWLLISSLGRADGFPHGDLALQRTMGLLVNGGKPMGPEEALDYSLRWMPYRTYVTTYLFSAARSGRLDILSSAGEVGP
jgi:DNA-3-methyladenine glycosylase II